MRKLTIFLLAMFAAAHVYTEEFKEIAPLEQRIKIGAQPVENNNMENILLPQPEKLEKKTEVKSEIEKTVKSEIGSGEKAGVHPEMTKDKIEGRVLDLGQKRMSGGLAYADNEDKPYTGTFALFLGDFIEYTETFVNGILEGPKTWYSENGNIVLQEYYRNNKVEGEQKAYYENGAIKSVVEYKGSRVMGMVAYGRNGEILHKDDFKNGNGKWKYFWGNGNVLEEGQYKNWAKDGTWKKYRKNGELDTVTEYKNGRVVEQSWH
ncbi:toxin-antitoxin system YwqK family antitoxin [Fusobacterium sp.]|uniref:toxin-antitoxin system YwqK family antitoxin n=1 Tax=Fusobacterium sp. TaxID=68766 RepID=UPI00396CC7D8